jgi:hypothetical protein
MKKVGLTFLSLFLLFQAFYILTDINNQVLQDVKGVCALLAGIILLLHVAFEYDEPKRRCPDDDSHHHVHRVILFILLFNLFGIGTIFAIPPPAEVEQSRWAAAEVVALNVPVNTPIPTPGPNPSPSGKCERCGGSGRIKPDGRIEIECPDCHGDGIVDMRDIIAAIGQLNKDLNRVEVEVLGKQKESKQMSVSPMESLPPVPPMPLSDPTQGSKLDKASEGTRSTSLPVIHWIEELNGLQLRATIEDKPVFIFWTADLCTPCEQAKQQLFSNPQILEYLNKYFLCARINASKETTERMTTWGIYGAPKFSLVLPDWKHQTFVKDPEKNETDPWNPEKFLKKLKEAHSQLYIEGAEKGSKAKKAARIGNNPFQLAADSICDCAITGICVCGPDCQCTNCPVRNTQVRYAIYQTYPQDTYVQDQNVICLPVGY